MCFSLLYVTKLQKKRKLIKLLNMKYMYIIAND